MSDAGVSEIRCGGCEYEVVWSGRESLYPPPEIPPPVEVTDEDRRKIKPGYSWDYGDVERVVLAQLPGTLFELSCRTQMCVANVMQALVRLQAKKIVQAQKGFGGRCYVKAGETVGLF